MKKTHPTPSETEGLRSEYRFDYSRAKSNRFAAQMQRPVVAVVLDSDVAAVFKSASRVNAQLRSVIAAGKRRKPATRARGRHRGAS